MRDPIKVYDARWKGGEFSGEEIERLLEAVLLYARELDVATITIARDNRMHAGSVMQALYALARNAGFAVQLCIDPISTPHSYFLTARATRKTARTMGIMITASHNPADYIGLKVSVPGVLAIGLDCGPLGGFARIREHYHAKRPLTRIPGGRVSLVNVQDEYIAYCMQAADLHAGGLKGLSLVLDSMHGSAGPELLAAFEKCGLDVLPLRLIPDGLFPSGAPNPTSRGKMNEALALAGRDGKRLVMGTDGDGDRLVFGSGKGLLLAGIAAVPIVESVCRSENHARVLHDPKVCPAALSEWSKHGIVPSLFRNGHSQIKNEMKRVDALAAVEESGHFYHRLEMDGMKYYCENSLLTALLFLKALQERPACLDELWTMQQNVFSTGELNFQFADEAARDEGLRRLIGRLREDRYSFIAATDEGVDLEGTVFRKGLSVSLENRITISAGWVNGYVRAATNESAVLRFYVSTGSRRMCTDIEKECRLLLGEMGAREIE